MKKSLITIVVCLITCGAAAETVLHDIAGYTPTSAGIRQFSVLVFGDDGRVIAIGNDALIGDYPDARVIDGNGFSVLPGLIDAHAHLYGLGLLATQLDLAGVPSVEQAVEMIAEQARANAYSAWLLGRGWNQVLWPVREFPTAADIDAVVSDRPVWLRRIDGHAAWANSAAMAIAGIDDDTPDPVGGKILRDENGVATGVFIDKAMNLVETHIPDPTDADYRSGLGAAIDRLLTLGITGVHDAGVGKQQAEVYMSMADDGELGIRVYAMIAGSGDDLDAIGEPIRGYGNDHLDVISVKLYADGALGSRGAAMLEPYDDDSENRGLLFYTQNELEAMVRKANGMGFQVGIHAIGDKANRMALDVFDAVQDGRPSPLRNRVEHAQIVAIDDIPRFAELGVVAAMQATHATSDMNMAEDRIGADRLKGGYAWRRMLDAGAVLANGSDFPVELPNPFHGLYATVTRQDRNGQPDGGWYSDQALTREEALYSFTLAAAYAAHQEDRLGSLEPGKWADFIVTDRDFFTVAASEIDDIRVLQTWVGGELAYSSTE